MLVYFYCMLTYLDAQLYYLHFHTDLKNTSCYIALTENESILNRVISLDIL